MWWGGGRVPAKRKKPKENSLSIVCQMILYKFKRRIEQCRCVKNNERQSIKGPFGGHYFG